MLAPRKIRGIRAPPRGALLLIGGVAALLPVPTAFCAPVPSGRGSRLRERPGEVLATLPAAGAAGCEFNPWATGVTCGGGVGGGDVGGGGVGVGLYVLMQLSPKIFHLFLQALKRYCDEKIKG